MNQTTLYKQRGISLSGLLITSVILILVAIFAQVDSIKSISGQDIKINKENNRIILSAKYTSKIPLVENISLNIDFEAISD